MCLLFCFVIFWILCYVMCEKNKNKLLITKKIKINVVLSICYVTLILGYMKVTKNIFFFLFIYVFVYLFIYLVLSSTML